MSLLGGGLDGVGLELLLAGLHLFGGGAAIADAGLPHLVQGGLDSFLRPAQGVLGVGVGHLVQLAAAVLGRMGCTTAAGANGVLCAFNLLPVRPLDGGRALYLLLAWLAGPGTAEWGCRWVGISTALAAASGTAWLVWRTGGSLWLLPAIVGLLMAGAGWRDDR